MTRLLPPTQSLDDVVHQLRIVVVSDSIPERNGVGTYYNDLCRHLEEEIEHISLICPHDDMTIRDAVSVPMLGDTTQRLYIPNFYQLYLTIRDKRPDIIIAATPGFYGFAAFFIALWMRCYLLVGFHTSFEHVTKLYWSRVFGYCIQKVFQFFHLLLFRKADCVVANSDYMRQLATKIGAENAQVVGTPVSYEMLHTPVSEPQATVQHVLFAGRLAAEKNLESLVEAAAALPQLKFTFAGDGPCRDLITDAAHKYDNVEYLGWLNRAQLLTEIDRTDIVALPSHVESFGTIALEGMARQRCALVSQHCGIIQWPQLAPGLFQIGENESVADALLRVATMPAAERNEIVKIGRKAAYDLNQWNIDSWLSLMPAADVEIEIDSAEYSS